MSANSTCKYPEQGGKIVRLHPVVHELLNMASDNSGAFIMEAVKIVGRLFGEAVIKMQSEWNCGSRLVVTLNLMIGEEKIKGEKERRKRNKNERKIDKQKKDI